MKDILVSVIMPSLNMAGYIEECVQSVTHQTLQEIEILCIDAGSDDGTLEILKRLADSDDRIQVISSEVKSYGYQVNLGIKQAKGKYVAVVETDDYIDSAMYEDLYKTAEKYDCDYVKSDYYAYWTQNNGQKMFFKRKSARNNGYGKVIKPVQEFSDYYDWYLWTGIYKKSFLMQHKIMLSETPGAAFQDIGFIVQTTAKAERAVFLPGAYYRYCIDRENSSSNSGKSLSFCFQEYHRILNEFCWSKEELKSLYVRMVVSVVVSLRRTKSGVWHREEFEWFQFVLTEAVQKNLVVQDVLPDGYWERLAYILKGFDIYKHYEAELESNRKKVLAVDKGKPIVIFGCGHIGYEAYKWMMAGKYNLFGFMDNNEAFWGQSLNGVEIISPQKAAELPQEVRFLVANELYYKEIVKQLSDMEIAADRICVF